ncbi:MAG: 4-chlorobenzoate--CoA ligase, partial [Thermoleophilia bacterium]
RPKGVPRSHRADRAGGLSQVLQHGYRFGDRTLGVMPLYHTMGMHSLIAMSLIGGCYVCQPDWDAEEALRLIEQERITSLYLAPTLYHDLVHHPRLA